MSVQALLEAAAARAAVVVTRAQAAVWDTSVVAAHLQSLPVGTSVLVAYWEIAVAGTSVVQVTVFGIVAPLPDLVVVFAVVKHIPVSYTHLTLPTIA